MDVNSAPNRQCMHHCNNACTKDYRFNTVRKWLGPSSDRWPLSLIKVPKYLFQPCHPSQSEQPETGACMCEGLIQLTVTFSCILRDYRTAIISGCSGVSSEVLNNYINQWCCFLVHGIDRNLPFEVSECSIPMVHSLAEERR